MKKIIAMLLAMLMVMSLAACANSEDEDAKGAEGTKAPEAGMKAGMSGVEDGILTVAMECAYAPYNWSQPDDSNGAVPIKNAEGEYANGYDVMMAKKLCEANGWKLEVMRLDWDSLVPAVQNGEVDAVIAGQSMTAERMEMVDFAGPYLYATIVCLAKKDSPQAAATGKSQLTGNCTSQLGTIWYDTCLPQIKGANIQSAAETAPAMLMALETGAVDFVCTDMPTAQGALVAIFQHRRHHAAGAAGGSGDDDSAVRILLADGKGIGADEAVFSGLGTFVDVLLLIQKLGLSLHLQAAGKLPCLDQTLLDGIQHGLPHLK